jgi:methionyl-tRNA formyltransferase
MRTVFMGTSDFAVDVLRALAASPHKPQLVITPPDRPKGRGRKLSSPPAADAARELGIELLQAKSVNDEEPRAAIAATKPEAICVCQFGQLIKEPLLSDYLILNVHTSVLPRWRGAAPIERALMAGDAESGVTIFQIEAGLDSGPVALSAPEQIQPDDTAGTLAARLSKLGGTLLIEALDRGDAGSLEFTEQPEEGITYADKIEPSERRLAVARPAAEVERVIRALTPHIGAYIAFEDGERLGVTSASVADDSLDQGRVQASDGRVLVGCGEGALELIEVQPPGKRPMPVAAFLRGHALPARVEL